MPLQYGSLFALCHIVEQRIVCILDDVHVGTLDERVNLERGDDGLSGPVSHCDTSGWGGW